MVPAGKVWARRNRRNFAASRALRFDGFNRKDFKRDAKTASRGGENVVSSRAILG
jgi:hypothetical protein